MFSASTSGNLSSSSSLLATFGNRKPTQFPLVDAPRQTHMIDSQELQRLLVRQRIVNMFRRYVPTKMHRLDIALLRYHGREDILLRSLVAKFGPEPPFSMEQQQLSDVLTRTMQRAAAASSNTATVAMSCSSPTNFGGRTATGGAQLDAGRHERSNLTRDAFDSDSEVALAATSPSSEALCAPPLVSPGRMRLMNSAPLHAQISPRCRTTTPHQVGSSPCPALSASSPRLPSGGPTSMQSSAQGHDAFPAAVALVAYHHQLRTRLFEAYTAKRSVIRLQEEKDRDALQRIAASEFRQITSHLSRKQAEALMTAQREKAATSEMQVIQRRMEESRIAWLNTQANTLLQRSLVKREDTMSEERIERRALAKLFSDEIVRLFRHERRISRLREAAEQEARRLAGNITPPPSGHQQRERLEEALISNRRRNMKTHRGAGNPSAQPRAEVQVSPEIALFQNFGVAVSYSVGAEQPLGLMSSEGIRHEDAATPPSSSHATAQPHRAIKLPQLVTAHQSQAASVSSTNHSSREPRVRKSHHHR